MSLLIQVYPAGLLSTWDNPNNYIMWLFPDNYTPNVLLSAKTIRMTASAIQVRYGCIILFPFCTGLDDAGEDSAKLAVLLIDLGIVACNLHILIGKCVS